MSTAEFNETATGRAAPPGASRASSSRRRGRRRTGSLPSLHRQPTEARSRLLLGRRVLSAWSVWTLLLATAGAYLWNLSANGWGNGFYAAAAQAGAHSWTGFIFGSSDLANSITVDKAPAFLWPMDISVRLFGVNSYSLMAPEVLMGVVSVGLVYASVARAAGRRAGLLAGWSLALTPVAALMFRFDNPEALMLMLMSIGAWATVRAIDSGRIRWMVLCGVALGFAFLAKQFQGLLVVPGFGLAYVVLARGTVRRRLTGLLAATVAMVVSAGWWVALVMLTPASQRPYIGGSQTNSFWDLTFGYNGIGRITGNEAGSVGGGATETPSLWRMFNGTFGPQVSWLLPAAFVLLVATLLVTRKAVRTDLRRATAIVWGSWLVVTWGVFSIMQGIQHAYYSVALAPAIAALVGLGAAVVWDSGKAAKFFAAGSEADAVVSGRSTVTGGREAMAAGTWQFTVLGGTTVLTAFWSFLLLANADGLGWLRWFVLFLGLVVGAALVFGAQLPRQLLMMGAVGALLAGLLGPAAYTAQTLASGHQGSLVTAGTGASMGGAPGGSRGTYAPGGSSQQGAPGAGTAAQAGRGLRSAGQVASSQGSSNSPQTGSASGSGMGGIGTMLNTSTPSQKLLDYLEEGSSGYTWMLAVVGSNNAAGYQLESGQSVMPIGGYNGTDPSPTLAKFEELVKQGKIHYYIPGTISSSMGGGSSSGSQDAEEINSWVTAHFASTSVDGTKVYDLTAPAS